METVRAISFDFWQTLAKSNPGFAEKRNKLLERYSSYPPEMVANIVKSLKYSFDQDASLKGIGRSSMDCIRELWAELVSPDQKGYARKDALHMYEQIQMVAYENQPIILPETVQMLIDLRKKGYFLGIISNTNFISGWTLRKILDEYDFRFNQYFFSDQQLSSKPAPSMFEKFIQKSGCMPENIMHIGDDKTNDIAGASACGCQTLLVLNPQDTITKVTELFLK